MKKRTKIIAIIALLLIIFIGLVVVQVLDNIGSILSKSQSSQMYGQYDYYSTSTSEFISPQPLVYYPERTTGGDAGFARFFKKSPNAPTQEMPKQVLTKSDFSDTSVNFALYWLGHSSAILELDSKRILIDPVLENAAPFPYITSRYSSSPITRDELPHIDIVLITHDHYDHLEMATIKELSRRDITFVVPLGVGSRIANWGVETSKIKELDWENSIIVDELKITACPMVHYSGRSRSDRNRTLWNGYAIKSDNVNIFWSGDTGYGEHFKDIGEKYGPFDLACVEIDGWNAGWPNTYLFPEEAIRVCQAVGDDRLFPIHWGVFDLALHPWTESINMVWDLAIDNQIEIIAPIMGEKVVSLSFESRKWWDNID